MTAPLLKTTGLCRYYRGGPQQVRALEDVEISLNRGEFLSIVGASGSGKSTLLNLLAGLDTPTSGEIVVDGVALHTLSRRELAAYRARRVGMIFQTFNLIAHRTALENVELALYFGATPRSERRSAAVDILRQLGLEDRLDHLPGDLSGGEQQRVAIARALVKQPEILLADEPTGNLDHDNTRQIAELIAGLNRDGLTVVMVTHDRMLARGYAHRILSMDYGRISELPPSAISEEGEA